jgi:hypothetical protein
VASHLEEEERGVIFESGSNVRAGVLAADLVGLQVPTAQRYDKKERETLVALVVVPVQMVFPGLAEVG